MSTTTTKARAQKPAPKKSEGFKGIKNAFIIILICILLAEIIFYTVFGNGSNFQGGDSDNEPVNLLGTVFKGGFVVPIIQGLLFTVIAITIERWLALKTAFGKENLDKFTEKIRKAMANNDIPAAIKACDAQKGSAANIVRAALERYEIKDIES